MRIRAEDDDERCRPFLQQTDSASFEAALLPNNGDLLQRQEVAAHVAGVFAHTATKAEGLGRARVGVKERRQGTVVGSLFWGGWY